MPYVASSLGQQMRAGMQSERIIAVAVAATDGRGKISAAIIPVAAISAKPTNGWRGALSNFICWAFRLSSLYKASRNHRDLKMRERPTPNIEHRTIFSADGTSRGRRIIFTPE